MRIAPTTLLLPLITFAIAADEPKKPEWKELFDGKSLKGWKHSDYGPEEATVKDGVINIPMAERLAGITYAGEDLPKMNYEVELEARRVMGYDFFVGLTFPVGDAHASLIMGGWGGAVCGISSLDDEDANSNETRKIIKFKKGQWYKVRLRVEPERIRAWLDGEEKPFIDAGTKGKKIGIRGEIGPSRPFGLATFATEAEVKSIRLRKLPAEEKK